MVRARKVGGCFELSLKEVNSEVNQCVAAKCIARQVEIMAELQDCWHKRFSHGAKLLERL